MKYSFESRVRFSEVDENAYLSLPAMINYLQDCATFHGEEGKIGIYWIDAHKKMWVLASLRLHIIEYPKFAETIITSTWASGFRNFIGYRDFTIERPDGTRLVEGKSEWVFMDQQTGMPCGITQDQIDGYGVHPEMALPERYGKRKIRVPKECREGEPFTILESHLDTNHHVNNAQYMIMSQNCLPRGFEVHHLRTEYIKQAFLGDEILPCIAEKDGIYTVVLKNRNSGDIYFIGEFAR